jgi:hypothetical protein
LWLFRPLTDGFICYLLFGIGSSSFLLNQLKRTLFVDQLAFAVRARSRTGDNQFLSFLGGKRRIGGKQFSGQIGYLGCRHRGARELYLFPARDEAFHMIPTGIDHHRFAVTGEARGISRLVGRSDRNEVGKFQ